MKTQLEELVNILHDEELIRFAYRLKRAGNKDLADLLKVTLKSREKKEEKK